MVNSIIHWWLIPTIIGKLRLICGGASQNFWKKSPTIIGNFKEKSKWSTQNFSRKKLLSHYNWTLAARNLTVYRKILLTIYGHLHIVWRGVSGKNKNPPTYIGKLQCFCRGISLNFCKKIFFRLTKDTKIRKFGVYRKILPSIYTKDARFQNTDIWLKVTKKFHKIVLSY